MDNCLYVEGIAEKVTTACKLNELSRKYVDFLLTVKENEVRDVPAKIYPDLMVYRFSDNSYIPRSVLTGKYLQYNKLSGTKRIVLLFYPSLGGMSVNSGYDIMDMVKMHVDVLKTTNLYKNPRLITALGEIYTQEEGLKASLSLLQATRNNILSTS